MGVFSGTRPSRYARRTAATCCTRSMEPTAPSALRDPSPFRGAHGDRVAARLRDLARTEQEPLLAKVRKLLRAQHGFPRGAKNKFGIDAVFSTEPLRFPESSDGCALDTDGITGLNCAGFGSAMVVTASFGMVAAAHVLRMLAATGSPAGAAIVAAD